MDISADLIELGRSNIAVVSSGVKSILDIGRTLEYLETHGVCVATFQSEDRSFPAFYTRASGHRASYDFATAEDAAAALEASLELDLGSGFLIGAPVPQEHAIDGCYWFVYILLLLIKNNTESEINNAIDNAIAAAKADGIIGKEATPYLLSAIAKITEGRSLQTSMCL